MSRKQLTKNFYLDEFTRSQIAARIGRQIAPTPAEVDNLGLLCGTVLQPIRERLGSVHVSSGLRPLWLNRKLGSSDNSFHVYGLAADFNISGLSTHEAAYMISTLDLPFDDLILEFGRWVHINVARAGRRPRRRVRTFTKMNGRTVKTNGISLTS